MREMALFKANIKRNIASQFYAGAVIVSVSIGLVSCQSMDIDMP